MVVEKIWVQSVGAVMFPGYGISYRFLNFLSEKWATLNYGNVHLTTALCFRRQFYILDSPNDAIYLAFLNSNCIRWQEDETDVKRSSEFPHDRQFLSNVKYILCEIHSDLQAIIFGAPNMNITSPGASKVFLIFRGFPKKYRHNTYQIRYVWISVCVCVADFTLDAELLARSQYSEGPKTGHLDTGFSWFPCVYKQMLRRLPRFQVATACFLCSPPDLNINISLTSFIFYLHVK